MYGTAALVAKTYATLAYQVREISGGGYGGYWW